MRWGWRFGMLGRTFASFSIDCHSFHNIAVPLRGSHVPYHFSYLVYHVLCMRSNHVNCCKIDWFHLQCDVCISHCYHLHSTLCSYLTPFHSVLSVSCSRFIHFCFAILLAPLTVIFFSLPHLCLSELLTSSFPLVFEDHPRPPTSSTPTFSYLISIVDGVKSLLLM